MDAWEGHDSFGYPNAFTNENMQRGENLSTG